MLINLLINNLNLIKIKLNFFNYKSVSITEDYLIHQNKFYEKTNNCLNFQITKKI